MSDYKDEVFVIETKQGKIVVEPMLEVAPNHVQRFMTLADDGFYNGCTFHRLIPGFMIQGGCPHSKDENLSNDGTGRSQLPNVKAEFSKTPHKRGMVSTARANDVNSANSQFFIMHADYPSLDGQYTVWGKVIEGMDVVDKIVKLPKVMGDNPGKAAEMEKVYSEKKK